MAQVPQEPQLKSVQAQSDIAKKIDNSNTGISEKFAGDTAQTIAELNTIQAELRKLQATVKTRSFTYVSILFKRIATTTSSILAGGLGQTPTWQFNNKGNKNQWLDKDVRLCSLTLVPDANFQLHGKIEIDVNEKIPLLPMTATADFTDLASLQIPIPDSIDFILQRGKCFDIYALDDGTAGHITIIGLVGSYENIFKKVTM